MLSEISVRMEVVMLWFAFIAEVQLEPYSEKESLFKISYDLMAEIYVTCFFRSGFTHLNGLMLEDSIYELLMGETFSL